MASRLLDKVTVVGASQVVGVSSNHATINHSVQVEFDSRAATKISAVTIKLQGSHTGNSAVTGVTGDDDNDSNPALAVGSTAERVANGAFDFRINGTNFSKAAVSAGSVFTAAHVIGDGASALWGVILIYIDKAGLIISKAPLATQVYASAELAHVAGDALQAEPVLDSAGAAYIGRVLIQSDTTTWTANTDDMTNASDLTTATFLSDTGDFFDLASHTLTAKELVSQRAMFHITVKNAYFTRLYLSTLTGIGRVSAWLHSAEVR